MKSLLEFLTEGVLFSEFTFGFELEGCITKDSIFFSEKYENGRKIPTANYNLLKEKLTKDLVYGSGEINLETANCGDDPSIQPNKGDASFEYQSPVFMCSPQNYSHVIKTLEKWMTDKQYGIYTNSSCGFHHHISMHGITQRDIVWLYCNMACDPDFTNNFSSMIGYNNEEQMMVFPFVNDKESSIKVFEDLKKAIIAKDKTKIKSLLDITKKRLFRIHPQGTLEWRGPRDFLNEKNIRNINIFYKLLIKLIKKFRDYINSSSIESISLSKEELFSIIGIGVNDPNDFVNDLELPSGNIRQKNGKISYSKSLEIMKTYTPQNFVRDVMTKPQYISSILNCLVDDPNFKYNNQNILILLSLRVRKALEGFKTEEEKVNFAQKLKEAINSSLYPNLIKEYFEKNLKEIFTTYFSDL